LKFNLAQEMQKELIRKEMSINNIIEKERKTLQEEAAAFENKVQNNVFATQERAQAEYEKIMKKDQELLQRSQAMIAEFEKESITKSSEVTQSIMEYIKEYNSGAKFDFILTKMGGNMLYANEALDITDEVVKGLNAKHSVKE
jgi:outer membrane protein